MTYSVFAKIICLLFIASLAGCVTYREHRPAPPPPPPPKQVSEWVSLGSQKVSRGVDKDVIQLGRHGNGFRAIKLLVRHSDVEIYDLKVYFHNGEVFDVSVRRMIHAGGETRVIDLPGDKRRIDRIVLIYKTPRYEDRHAIVEVLGLRSY